MMTHTASAGAVSRAFPLHDPAGLLAEARRALRRPVRDSFVLIAHDGPGSRPLFARSSLGALLSGQLTDILENQFALMRENGASRATALVVIGDGDDGAPGEMLDDAAEHLAPRIIAAADLMLPEPFAIDAVWIVEAGRARQVLPAGHDDGDWVLAISPPIPLGQPDGTHAGPPSDADDGDAPQWDLIAMRIASALQALGAARTAEAAPVRGQDRPALRRGPEPMGRLFAEARRALGRLRDAEGMGTELSPRSVTDCERVASFLSTLDSSASHWALWEHCAEHGRREEARGEDVLARIIEDEDCIPHEDVVAGGSWFVGLQELRALTEQMILLVGADDVPDAVEAWRGLTVVLCLLDWWNHHLAAAGDLIDELREHDPASRLALLLSRLIDVPLQPAWRPSHPRTPQKEQAAWKEQQGP